MATRRISIDIDENEHKCLKSSCAKLGITIKEFVTKATMEKIDPCEKKYIFEKLKTEKHDSKKQ